MAHALKMAPQGRRGRFPRTGDSQCFSALRPLSPVPLSLVDSPWKSEASSIRPWCPTRGFSGWTSVLVPPVLLAVRLCCLNKQIQLQSQFSHADRWEFWYNRFVWAEWRLIFLWLTRLFKLIFTWFFSCYWSSDMPKQQAFDDNCIDEGESIKRMVGQC